MPELPEVETLKRELSKKIVGKTISDLKIIWEKTVSPTSPGKFKKEVSDKKILGLYRRAKMLLIKLSGNKTLAVHLKMTGQLIFVPQKGKMISGGHPTNDTQTPSKHTRLIFKFKDGDTLYFNDLRKFGWVRIVDEKLKKHLEEKVGIEPLNKDFNLEVFEKILRRFPNRTIKQVLLDQALIAGIGNIYADEAAHLSGILPMRKINKLKEKEITDLYKNVIAVLKLSIQKKDTSSKNYRRSDGKLGGFMPFLMVYGRENEACKKCGTPIRKIKHAGRGTHYCPRCQK